MSLIFKKSSAQPEFTVAATISGTLEATQTLTCAYTVVRARAANVTCRWYRHAANNGSDPTGVLLGTGTTYVLTGTDVGNYIRAIVTAINPAGTVTSTTAYTAIITSGEPPTPPTITTAAAITGTADVDETLTVTADFDGETSVTYQWYSYTTEPTGSPLTGNGEVELGTASTQLLTASEAGRWIVAVVTATNAAGSAVTSASVAMAGVDPFEPIAPTAYSPPAYDISGLELVYAFSGDDLQAKLNALTPGQCLVLEAGATWTGNYYFPNTNADGSDWIYVISSAMASLPAEGTRVTSADAANMPKIRASTRTANAMHVYRGVQKLRFVGIEFTTTYADRADVQYTIMPLGLNTHGSGNIDELIFDRCYIHGTTTGNNRDGINTYLAVKQFALLDSQLSDFHAIGYEAHALHIYQGQGPMLIRNNRFEASGINVFIGDNTQSFGLPEDITFVGNYCVKPLAWKEGAAEYEGIRWAPVKNLFEIKYGGRILVEGNIFERSFIQGEQGGGITVTPIGDLIADLNIKNNIIRDVAGQSVTLSASGQFSLPTSTLTRASLTNNLIYGSAKGCVTVIGAASKVVHYLRISHNTATHATVRPSGSTWLTLSQTPSGVVTANNADISDNCYTAGVYNVVFNTSASTDPEDLLDYRLSGEWYYRNNMAIEAVSPYSSWFTSPTANVYGHKVATSRTAARFTNPSLTQPSDFVLLSTSAGYNAATDGTDIGCNISELLAAIALYNDTTP